jgi:class 3 adenylate cyclase/YHS domain-containing protein
MYAAPPPLGPPMPRRSAIANRHARLLSAYVAPEVVQHILSDGRSPLPSGVRVPAVILFADLSGFTRLSARLPAERIVAMLDDFFDAVTRAARGSGAMIDKLIGDAVLLVFGVPERHADDVARVLRVATAMHAEFAAATERWRARDPSLGPIGLSIGCASGEVVLANVGSAARMDYTVIGTAVNLAARLVSAARRGSTLIDSSLRTRNGAELEGFRFGPERRLRLKGFASTVPACTVRARAPVAIASTARSLVDPLCGMKLAGPTRYYCIEGGRRSYFCSRRCREQWTGTARPAGRRRSRHRSPRQRRARRHGAGG